MCLRCQMTFGRRHIGRERGFPIPGPARSCPEEKLPSGEQMPGGREWDARGHAGERGKAPSFRSVQARGSRRGHYREPGVRKLGWGGDEPPQVRPVLARGLAGQPSVPGAGGRGTRARTAAPSCGRGPAGLTGPGPPRHRSWSRPRHWGVGVFGGTGGWVRVMAVRQLVWSGAANPPRCSRFLAPRRA